MPPRLLKGLQATIVLLLITGAGCTGPTPPPEAPAEEAAPEETAEATEPSPEPSPEPSAPAAPAPEAAEELTVLSVAEGEVLIMKSGTDEWADTQSGTTIEEGDALKTGERSQALVTFFDGSTIELEAGTEIEAVELRHDVDADITTIRLDQAIGNTLSRVKKLTDPASRYEVTTPAAVGAVRGSAMRVKVAEDGTSTVVNLSGSVTVSSEGVTKDIPPGYQREVKPGEEPGTLSLPTPSEPGEDEDGEDYTAAIAVNKTANPTVVHDGDRVTYTYVVTNSGEVALEDVSVTDDMVGDVACQAGDEDGDGELDVEEAWLFSTSYNVSDSDTSPLVNVASASASVALNGDERATVSDTDTATVTVLRPGVGLNKTAEPTVARVGDMVTYSYNVTNEGNTALTDIDLADGRVGGLVYLGGDGNGNDLLDVNEAWVFCGNYTVILEDENPVVNTASVNGTDALGMVVAAETTCSVTILSLDVQITEPKDGTIVGSSNVTVEGVVNDARVKSVDLAIDGKLYVVPVEDGWFKSLVPVEGGANTISATAMGAGGESDSDSITIYAHFKLPAIRIELTWDTTGDDLDGHFIRPDGTMWVRSDDCHWYWYWLADMPSGPDWDGSGDLSPGDPVLDIDDWARGGPEHVTLAVPPERGRYEYKVHFYSDWSPTSGSTATVKVWVDDSLALTRERTLQDGDIWNCVYIEWPSGRVYAPESVEEKTVGASSPAKK